MTHQEILTKAITKAIAGGWKVEGYPYVDPSIPLTIESVIYYFDDDHGELSVNDLIWRHDFAKALWGDTPDHHDPNARSTASYNRRGELEGTISQHLYNWAYHLQRMVIADDPIKYLGEHI